MIYRCMNEEWAQNVFGGEKLLIYKIEDTEKVKELFEGWQETLIYSFDIDKLKEIMESLPAGYKLQRIDGKLYEQCLTNPVTIEMVSSFANKEEFLKIGRGMVIMKAGEIVSGASSYTRYNEGIK